MTVEKSETGTKDNSAEVLAQLKALNDKVTSLEAENTRLVAFNDKVIQEKKEKEEKHRLEKEKLEQEKIDAKTHTKDEAAQLIQQYKDKLVEAENKIKAAEQKEYQSKVSTEARKLAEKLAAKDPIRAELLAEKMEKRIKLDDDGKLIVLDEKGNPTISSVDLLVNEVSQKYKCLVDGLDSSGGGSHSSGGAQVKKLSDMSESEKVSLYRTDIQQYRELEKLEP